MKRTKRILLLASVLIVSASCQKTGKSIQANIEVPEATKNTFKAKYSNADATKVDWHRVGNLYSAEFEANDTEFEALIDADGKLIRSSTERKISFDALPDNVKNAFLSSYGDATIEEVEHSSFSDGKSLYELEIRSEAQLLELTYDQQGVLLEEEIEDDSDDELEDELDEVHDESNN